MLHKILYFLVGKCSVEVFYFFLYMKIVRRIYWIFFCFCCELNVGVAELCTRTIAASYLMLSPVTVLRSFTGLFFMIFFDTHLRTHEIRKAMIMNIILSCRGFWVGRAGHGVHREREPAKSDRRKMQGEFHARARHVSILASVFSGLLKFRAIETGYACSVWAKRTPMDTD